MSNRKMLRRILRKLADVEFYVSNLDDSVNALKAEVTKLAERIPAGDLVEQLKAAQEALATALFDDEADKAAIASALQDIAENVDEVDRVTNQIRTLGNSADVPEDDDSGEPTDVPEDGTPVGTGAAVDGNPGQEPFETNPARVERHR